MLEATPRIKYSHLDNETMDKYFYLQRISKACFDLHAGMIISSIKTGNAADDRSIHLYESQQLIVHVNEALKLLIHDPMIGFKEYIDDDFKCSKEYKMIDNAIAKWNFSATDGYKWTKFHHDMRVASVHYNDRTYEDVYKKCAFELKGYIPKINKYYSEEFDLEQKANMIHLNIFVTEEEIEINEWAKYVGV
jgi:hypothetical protein